MTLLVPGIVLLSVLQSAGGCAAAELEPDSSPTVVDDSDAVAPDAPPLAPDADAGALAFDDPGSCSSDHWCRVAQPVAKAELRAIWGSGPDDIWAVGAGGVALHWDGHDWSSHPPSASPDLTLNAVWGSGAHDVWAVGESDGGPTIWHSSGVEGGWSTANQDDSKYVGIAGSGPDDIWAVGTKVSHYTGPDAGWVDDSTLSQRDGGYPKYTAVTALGGGEVWIGSASPYIDPDDPETTYEEITLFARRLDAGATEWSTLAVPASLGVWNQIFGLAVPDRLHVYFSSWSSTDYSLADYWRGTSDVVLCASSVCASHPPPLGPLVAVWSPAPDVLWGVGPAGAIVRWDGSAWTISKTAIAGVPIGGVLTGLWGASEGDLWAVGTKGTILHRNVAGNP